MNIPDDIARELAAECDRRVSVQVVLAVALHATPERMQFSFEALVALTGMTSRSSVAHGIKYAIERGWLEAVPFKQGAKRMEYRAGWKVQSVDESGNGKVHSMDLRSPESPAKVQSSDFAPDNSPLNGPLSVAEVQPVDFSDDEAPFDSSIVGLPGQVSAEVSREHAIRPRFQRVVSREVEPRERGEEPPLVPLADPSPSLTKRQRAKLAAAERKAERERASAERKQREADERARKARERADLKAAREAEKIRKASDSIDLERQPEEIQALYRKCREVLNCKSIAPSEPQQIGILRFAQELWGDGSTGLDVLGQQLDDWKADHFAGMFSRGDRQPTKPYIGDLRNTFEESVERRKRGPGPARASPNGQASTETHAQRLAREQGEMIKAELARVRREAKGGTTIEARPA